ncbi:UDP-N-acetylmuramate--L-alanine ligase [Prochlorococcus sp. MIT 0916]|uniref:UDP-N-acetylmuramate--L-alanine ligase n=1 Tax=Prochlorococcus marinus str. P0903-H212 TaxID=1622208 RepID=A0A0D5A3N5_PROMR|nr:UDP-N-acetylmuramate--alanine ligase [Prochlorococcus marinus str. P0903-H212]
MKSYLSLDTEAKLKNSNELPHHIHFIGIGGIGMSGLAMILAKNGYSISGSDQKKSQTLEELARGEIHIFQTQKESNIDEIFKVHGKNILIVRSSAIRENNLELCKAKKYNLTINHRSEILAFLIEQKRSIIVSGSHGKTTTSTFIATLLSFAKRNPTAIIGGIVPLYKKNYNFSDGELLIAEADESDGSLVKFNPNIGLITNLELEHVDHYLNLEDLIKTMKQFAQKCENLIINYDCKNLKNNIQTSKLFSIQKINNIDFALIPKESNGCEISAEYYEKEKFIDIINIPVPGIHNLSNAVAAIAACRIAGIPFKDIKKGIAYLQLPLRRFDYKGLWKNRLIVEDYAHHPSEIDAAISIASTIIKTKNNLSQISPKRLVTIFQPHRFSRTKKFQKEFAKSLSKSDLVFISPIYSAGEDKIEGINNKSIGYELKKLKPNLEIYTPDNNQNLIKLIKENTIEKDLILIMGAGDINIICENLFLELINNKSIRSNSAA